MKANRDTIELVRVSLTGGIDAMQLSGNDWEQKLEECFKLDTENLDGELKEAADMFVKCENILGELK